MSLKRVYLRSVLALFLIPFCVSQLSGATDVWVSHIASQGGWKTLLSVYYTGTEPTASLTLTRMDESGKTLEEPIHFTASNNAWLSIPDSSLAYTGSARIRSASNMLVRTTYRYGESLSLCEFYAGGDARQEWVLSVPSAYWFDWTGIALVNSNDTSATVILEAWKLGKRLAVRSVLLSPRERLVNTSDGIWSGLGSREFDTAVIRASAPIPPPISITGNLAQDRHIFCTAQPRPQNEKELFLFNGTLIDGTGRDPVSDAVVGIRGGRIFTIEKRGETAIPGGADTVDVKGGFILPGFINAHVHNAFNESNLRTWARAGITTVRDVGSYAPASEAFGFRDSVRADPTCARLVAAGPLVTVPGGYPASVNFPALTVSSPQDARAKITEILDQGAEVVKVTIEDGLGQGIPSAPWPTLSPAEVRAIVETAHARKIPVTGHITFSKYLRVALDSGLDDCAHSIFDPLSDQMIQEMLRSGMSLVPTLRAQGENGYSLSNLRRFAAAGGKVAMGNDGGYIAGLEVGMPITELEAMREAGMTPMQIIVSATKNASEVLRIDQTVGTIEFGKEADLLIIRGNPLEDLRTLLEVENVIRGGTVIR